MLDRTIPFYNTILRCDRYADLPVSLPAGFRIVPYEPGLEKGWARLETAIGDFDTPEEAEAYFLEKYPGQGDPEDILFLLTPAGEVIGSCIAWLDERSGAKVNSLHWLVVDERYQRRGLGRALSCAVMDRFLLRNGDPVYIHTQPWSWKAILLYRSLGFRLQRSDSFASYENQFGDAVRTLTAVLGPDRMRDLLDSAED